MPFHKIFEVFKKKKGGTPGKKAAKNAADGPKDEIDYDAQRVDMMSDDPDKRISLAASSETHKEILYYLAEKDPDPRVRKAVASNDAMPAHASQVLANDVDEDVRMALARRLMGLLPDLSRDKHSQLYAFAVQALGTLALDEVLKIRIALSSTLKDHAHTPSKVASQLARDVEREVSEPILRFCAALSDDDLLDILKGHPASWAITAVASREIVSEPISEAVIETDDRPGGQALVENTGAQISEIVLEKIVDKSRDYPEWQKPIANRGNLPVSIAKQLASFVDASVRDILLARGDFDPVEMEEITSIFRRRVDFASEEEKETESVAERVDRLHKEGRLNEETISDALAMRDTAFVNAALGRLLGVTTESVVKIVEMQAPKSIIALAWKAGLSMRLALQLQKDLAKVHHKQLIYPKDGTDFPFDKDELLWQLEFLGLKK